MIQKETRTKNCPPKLQVTRWNVSARIESDHASNMLPIERFLFVVAIIPNFSSSPYILHFPQVLSSFLKFLKQFLANGRIEYFR